MWREPYLPGSVIYVLHQIHPCLCLCAVFFIFSVEPCLYDLCVCVCCILHYIHPCPDAWVWCTLYWPLPSCLSVVYRWPVNRSAPPFSHTQRLCLSAVRKSFFYPESASQHSLPSTQWRKCTLRLKLYMGKAWWTANPGSAFPIVHVQCAEAAFSC